MRNNGEVISPQLQSEWHPTKNAETFEKLPTRYSKRMAWWRCHFGHEWQSTPQTRYKGSNCPYCSNKLLLPGYNDLATVNPVLAMEWDSERNTGGADSVLHLESRRKCWWLCGDGHSWEATPYTRQSRGCPYCSNRYVLRGYNDLETTHQEISQEWHSDNQFLPWEITGGSNRQVRWRCLQGHAYTCTPSARINRGRGCPYCSNQRVLSNYNDLASINPDLASQWHRAKNHLSPTEVTAGSNKKAWWICNRGHEWQASINSRNQGRGCPSCPAQHSSEEEVTRNAFLPGSTPMLLPIPFRSRGYCLVDGVMGNRILEYDGSYWHRESLERDLEKTLALLGAGYCVLRVRMNLSPLSLEHPRYLELHLNSLMEEELHRGREILGQSGIW